MPAADRDGWRSGANLIVRHRFASPTVIRLGPLILIPTMSLCSYDTFRSTYNAAYAIAQSTGLAFDGRGPEPLVYQTTSWRPDRGDTQPVRQAERSAADDPAEEDGLRLRAAAAARRTNNVSSPTWPIA
jgi:hypothetical protein